MSAKPGPTRLVFVVGNSRSGTTMMARALGRHSLISGLPELHFLERQVALSEVASGQPVARDAAIDHAARLFSKARIGYFKAIETEPFQADAEAVLSQLQPPVLYPDLFRGALLALAQDASKPIALEQTPQNVFYLQELLNWYDDAVVVNMVRDPRDVLLSQKNKWKRRRLGADIPKAEALRAWMNYHPVTTSRLWSMAVRSGDAFTDHPRVITMKFEDLLQAPEDAFRQICDRIGIEFEQDIMNVAQIGSSTRDDVAGGVGADPGRIAAWTKGGLTKAEIAICERITAPLMQRHGYGASGQSDIIMQFLSYLSLSFTLVGPLMLKLSRICGLVSDLSRRMRISAI